MSQASATSNVRRTGCAAHPEIRRFCTAKCDASGLSGCKKCLSYGLVWLWYSNSRVLRMPCHTNALGFYIEMTHCNRRYC